MYKSFLKRICIVIFLSITILSCKQYKDDSISQKKITILKKYYSCGQLKEVGALIDSLKYGYWVTYNVDGSLDTECTYFNDSLKGPLILYYSNGNIKVKGSIDKGEWRAFILLL